MHSAPLGHQNASKETSTGPNVMPKWCQRGRRQGAEPLNPPRLCMHKPHGVSGPAGCGARCPVHVHAHLQNVCFAEMWFSPYENPLGRVKSVFYLSPTYARPLPLASVLGGCLGPVSGLGKHRCARLRLVGALSCPKCSTMRPETTQGAQRDRHSSLLDLPGRPFWSKFAKMAPLSEPHYLLCFHDKKPLRERPLSHS